MIITSSYSRFLRCVDLLMVDFLQVRAVLVLLLHQFAALLVLRVLVPAS